MNLQEIKDLYPCGSGWRNLIKHYPTWQGTLLEFMDLENIPNDDKIWLFSNCKEVDDYIKKEFAITCAEIAMQYADTVEIHEFHTFNLLEWVSGENDYAAYSAAYSAARSAARSAANSAANSAAYSAANSAAYYAARSAARSAANSAANSAAYSAANSAAYSADYYAARSAARSDQLDIIKNLLESELNIY